MNRFPKMMILWKTYFESKGENEIVSRALGHACATAFAIAKNIRRAGKKTGKKTVSASDKRIPRTGWWWYDIPYIPHKGVWLKYDRHGLKYKLANKEVYGEQEYAKQVRLKFTDEDQYNRYLNFAKTIVNLLGAEWKRKWYKTWRKIRDWDWSTADPYLIFSDEKTTPLSVEVK